MKYIKHILFIILFSYFLFSSLVYCQEDFDEESSNDTYKNYDSTKDNIIDEINTETPGLGDFLEDAVDIDSIIDEHASDIDSYLQDL